MITLSDLNATEVQYLRAKWVSELTEINKELARKRERLEQRLASQGEDAVAQATLQADLAHAQAVLDVLNDTGADENIIAAQEAVIAGLQDEVASFGLSSSYVSNTDAMLQQMELDELKEGITIRTTKVSEIDAL